MPAAVERRDAGPPFRVTLACVTATAALAPAYVVRWHVGFYPTTALEAAILITLASFLVESARLRQWPAWRSSLTFPTAVFLLAASISILAAPSFIAALGVYRAYFVEPILIALVLVTVLQSARQAQMVVLGFCAGATVLGLANSATVLQAILNHGFNPQLAPPSAIYPVGNMVALYLVPLVAVTASLLFYGRDTRLRLVFGVFTAVAALSVILSLSRGGWVALGAVAVGLALSARRRRLWVGVMLAAVLALALIPPVAERASAALHDPTLDGRTEGWAVSIRMLSAHPLLGAGLSGFMQRVDAMDSTIQWNFPHNIALNFWSETGLLGLASFTVIFAMVAVFSRRGWRHGAAEWRPLHLGVLLGLVAIFVHGLVDNPYFKNDLSFEFWVLVALTLVGRRAAVTGLATPSHGMGREVAANRTPSGPPDIRMGAITRAISDSESPLDRLN